MYRSIEEIIEANKRSGGLFFDKSHLKNSTAMPIVIGGRFFITRDVDDTAEPETVIFRVREAKPNGRIAPMCHNEHRDTLEAAVELAKMLAAPPLPSLAQARIDETPTRSTSPLFSCLAELIDVNRRTGQQFFTLLGDRGANNGVETLVSSTLIDGRYFVTWLSKGEGAENSGAAEEFIVYEALQSGYVNRWSLPRELRTLVDAIELIVRVRQPLGDFTSLAEVRSVNEATGYNSFEEAKSLDLEFLDGIYGGHLLIGRETTPSFIIFTVYADGYIRAVPTLPFTSLEEAEEKVHRMLPREEAVSV